MNRILESVAHAHAKHATYVDTWHLLDDFHGRYAAYLRVHGKLTQMRLPDGVHYTQAGGDLVAAQVVAQLRAWYRLEELVDREQVDDEDERLVRLDHAARAARAVGHADGIVSRRRPPTFIPATPWSQPGITWPLPSLNSNG